MIPRILLNNIQNVKKFVMMYMCFYALEHLPSLDMLSNLVAKEVNVKTNTSDSVVKKSPARLNMKTKVNETDDETHLILLWTEYQMIGKDIYDTIFSRITNNQCKVSNCRFTTDRSRQNESSAIIFHMPNLHWENYTYPEYRYM